MLDGYHLLTLTHREVPLAAIGNALLPEDGAAAVLQNLKQHFGWEELLYLGTCNRAMYLFYSQAPVESGIAGEMLPILRPDLPAPILDDTAAFMRVLHGSEAISHLLEVASSMDSLVVGEREIIRQLRQAYEHSRSLGLTGDHLRLLMRFTMETAKEIYTRTGIGEKALSIVALAFGEMIKTGLRPDARILMVGAGQTNVLFSKFLAKKGFHNVTVFNRTLEKAEALAKPFGGQAFPLDELEFFSEGFDALVVCTGAAQAVVTFDIYQKLLGNDIARKVVVDLAVPNNVDKRVTANFSVQYIEIENLREVASENLAHRERERTKAESIIQDRIFAYRDLWHERQVERALAHIPDEVRAVKERAVNEVFGKEFAQLDPATQELVLQMLGYMEKKYIAIPMKAAKAIALRGKKRHMTSAESNKTSIVDL